jgi:hypothetical protein
MNFVKKLVFIFLALLIVSCSSIPPSIDSDILVKMKTSACYGECPIYTVAVKKNGELTYEGLEYVSVKGVKSAILPKESIALIEAELIKAKFLKMQSKLHSGSWGCFISATDHSYILVEASIKNKKKAVSTYTGCQSEQVNKIIELESYLKKITEISEWVEKNS